MKFLTLLGMVCSGHGGYPPRPSVTANSMLRVEGVPIVCNGDQYAIHCDDDDCHPGTGIATTTLLRSPSGNLLLQGDPISCGSTVAQTFPNIRVHV